MDDYSCLIADLRDSALHGCDTVHTCDDCRFDKCIMKESAEAIENLLAAIKKLHAADVVEVVRCKDCAYSDLRQITDEGHTVRVCEIWGYVDDTHFCNDGRWRDDG